MFFSEKAKRQKRLLRTAKQSAPYAYESFLEYAASLAAESPVTEVRKLGLKLLVIADTHGILQHDRRLSAFIERIGEYDLCLLLGDVDCCDIEYILELVPAEKILAVRGNHDCMDLTDLGIRDLHGKAFTCKGVRFVGFEGAFKYKKGIFPCYTQYQSLRVSRRLPRRADVLVTHDGALSATADKAHPGLVGITRYLADNRVQYHLHGHVHRSYDATYPCGTKEKSVYLWECIEI